jgi:hypothetical protein
VNERTPVENRNELPRDPTDEELRHSAVALLAEVDDALSTDRWAILDNGTDSARHRMYDAAALRHCCRLLHEIEAGAATGQELTVRVMGRVHIEAWIHALYIHFGGHDALTRIAQETRYQLEAMQQHMNDFDQRLAADKKAARRRVAKVRKANVGIARWNTDHPDETPKPLLVEPHVPQLEPSPVDLTARIENFGDVHAQKLPMTEVIDALTKLAQHLGFGRESFEPIYLVFRALSGGATHPNLNVLDAYLHQPGNFVRTVSTPTGDSMITNTSVTALYSTAYLASWILGDAGHPTPVADALRARLEPDLAHGKGWAPGR